MTQIRTWPDGTNPDAAGPPDHLAPVADEAAVLGACLASPRALDAVLPSVPSGAIFYQPRHGYVWDAIAACWTDGERADTLNVAARLDAAGVLGNVDPTYLAYLDGAAPSGALANPAPYLERVLDAFEKRAGDAALTRGHQLLATPGAGDAATILDAVTSEIDRARDARLRRGNAVRVGALVDDVLAGLDPEPWEEERPGVPWPYRDLGGRGAPMNPLMPGQMVSVAGRPGTGKSTILKDCCEHVSFDLGWPSLLVSWEMRAPEITARVLSHQARVPLTRLVRPGLLDASDRARIDDYRRAMAAAPLIVVDDEDTSLGEIDRLIREHRPRLVALDYLQIAVPDGPPERRRLDVERFTRAIKKLAARREVPILVGSQLNRASETRRDKTPHLADLRETGAIEQDCDAVLLLHREDLYEAEGPRVGEVDVIIAKQRNGPTDTVTLANRLHYASLHDMAR
jgi:replicative DNA helicase